MKIWINNRQRKTVLSQEKAQEKSREDLKRLGIV